MGRAQARLVAVEADDRLVGQLPEQGQLGLGDRRAERRHGVGEAGLGERDHVHVALGDDHRAALADRCPGERQAVQQLALVEQRRVGGVQILGPRLAERAAAEADDPAAPVVDREHHPVAEAVEARAAVLGLDQEARLDRAGLAVALGLERALERGAVGRRIAEPEAEDGRAVEPAFGQIGRGLGALRALQAPGQPARRRLVDRVEGAIDRRLGVAGAARRRQAGQLGEAGDRLAEVQALERHDEVDRVAVLAAAEAVIEALGLGDRERGRLFLVERAQAQVLAAAAREPDVARDDLDQGQARLELLERDRAPVSHHGVSASRPLRGHNASSRRCRTRCSVCG